MNSYSLRLPDFEGPLDLLLQLIERRRLDVTTVSLAQVTEQYLEYLSSLEPDGLDAWSEFLVIAARLLLIKSRRLLLEFLHQEQDSHLEDEANPGQELVRQLLEFRRFRPAIVELRAREEKGLRSYPRLAPPPRPLASSLEGINLGELRDALRRVLARREPPESNVQELLTITIDERVREIREQLAQAGRTAFGQFLTSCLSRTEMVVTFLALLELIKRGEVAARQEKPFDEIIIEWAPYASPKYEVTLSPS